MQWQQSQVALSLVSQIETSEREIHVEVYLQQEPVVHQLLRRSLTVEQKRNQTREPVELKAEGKVLELENHAGHGIDLHSGVDLERS